ncbi:hypothetical protein DSLASN_45130 [Desulfoluna limicola]|uniref:histidine kinase n=1 Tax=Desulfoluna limicola TaxID=2810562 RepID=A0ABM7PMX3_9BACT|nr:ABC transporter substrate binding protein [Desulfoluna limicola]BCS98881.1 hypothetical protein DSLASN_45130 [Desulfoluna limicola]
MIRYRTPIALSYQRAQGSGSGRRPDIALCAIIVILFTTLFVPAPAASEPLHILYINSYHAGYKWSDDIEAGIRERLNGAAIDHILHVEFMDTKRSTSAEALALFHETLRAKYSRVTLQVIITSDDSAFSFIKENRDQLFGNVPVVFCGVNYLGPSALDGITNITGINESADIEGTLDMILALHKNVRRILVVNDTSPTGQRMGREITWVRQHFSDRLAFTILDKLPMEHVLNRVANATSEEVVLYVLFLKDSLGQNFEYDDSVRAICNSSTVPVYGLWDFQLGHGIVGGNLLTGRQQGGEAGGYVLKIIRGEKADTIRILMESQATPLVDYRVMSRFGIPENKLPRDTRIVNRPFSFFEAHKDMIARVAVSIVFLSALLFSLIFLLIQQKQVKKELVHRETQLRIALDGTDMGLWQWEIPSGRFTVNNGWISHLGFNDNEKPSSAAAFHERILPEDRHNMHQALSDLLASRTDRYTSEYRVKKKDGSMTWVLDRGRVIAWGGDGNPTHLAGTFIDILDRKTREQETCLLRDYLSSTINAMSTVIAAVDSDMAITLWNSEAESVTGTPRHDALNKQVDQALPLLANHRDLIARAMQTGEVQARYRIPSRSSALETHYDIWVFPISGTAPGGAVIRIDDITERIRMEEAMHHTEMMMSVGGLAAGIAHEINNPVAGIVQNTSLLLSRLTQPTPDNLDAAEKAGTSMGALLSYMELRKVMPLIDAIHLSGKRTAEIVKNILSYSRRNDSQMVPYQLTKLLDKTLSHLKNDLLSGDQKALKTIHVVRHYEKNLPDVVCEGAKIRQVFYTILANAFEALLQGSKPVQSPTLSITVQKESRMLRIDIEDNGPGMTEEACKLAFEPFFTTHSREKGRGLGLFIAYFIVTTGHGGQLDVASRPDVFTRFTLRLPLETDGPKPPSS